MINLQTRHRCQRCANKEQLRTRSIIGGTLDMRECGQTLKGNIVTDAIDTVADIMGFRAYIAAQANLTASDG